LVGRLALSNERQARQQRACFSEAVRHQ
jgi:hypothetical protein